MALLESESNKEDSESKRSLANLIVEDEDHRKYIIEIERNVKDSFIHKSLFNTSRLIVDNLAQREDYTQILKVFHISLLYFPIGSGLLFTKSKLPKDYRYISRIKKRVRYLTLPMLKQNLDIALISKITGLSVHEVQKLKARL